MNAERIDFALKAGGTEGSDDLELVFLTNRRVIHLHGKGKHRKTMFASIDDIESVEIGFETKKGSGVIWAGLAFLTALLLFFVIDHQIWRIAGTTTVVLLGVYLITDQILTPCRPTAIFKSGSSEIRCILKNDHAGTDAHDFAKRLFQFKDRVRLDHLPPDSFTPY